MAKVLAEGTGAQWAQVWLVVQDGWCPPRPGRPRRPRVAAGDREGEVGAGRSRCATAASCWACCVQEGDARR